MYRHEVRRTMALAAARELDGMAALGLAWWDGSRPMAGALPLLVSELPRPLSRLVTSAALISVTRLSPARFQFSLLQAEGRHSDDCAVLSEMPGRLREQKKPFYDELSFAVFSGAPTYRLVESYVDGTTQEITRRLILPLAAGGNVVEQLVMLLDVAAVEGATEPRYAAL